MKTSDVLQHGGNLTEASRIFGAPTDGWVDLSTGISPYPYPIGNPLDGAWTRLPGQQEETDLRAAARVAYGAPDNASIVMAPGTQVLIQQLPHLFKSSNVVVCSPTYGEHSHCWRLVGHQVKETAFTALPDKADIVVVVNPNNPDGVLLPPDTLETWSAEMAKRNGYLIVDEAFADITPKFSVAKSAGRAGLIVLRSFGKFFGLAGLRLGFALCDDIIYDKLSATLGPWSVSGPALDIGARALSDHAWQVSTRQKLADAAERLDQLLSNNALPIVGGTTLFRLIEHPRASDLYKHLAHHGILSRPFDYQPHWLRLGLPAGDADWDRLSKAFKSFP
jgi:cobalamin biosynthetic protein CobC